MSILFVRGLNDRSRIRVSLNREGRPVYIFDGSCAVYKKMSFDGIETHSVLMLGANLKQPNARLPSGVSLVFNQISDPDSHRGALRRCNELVDHLGLPVINHPAQIRQTTRDRVSDSLLGIPGVSMPRTVRFQPRSPEDVVRYAEAVEFERPYIARVAGDHNGKTMVRVSDPSDLSELDVLPFDGRDFYLTEYVDYRDEEGLYHKQRFVVIDGEPILRHAIYDRDWNVHGHAARALMQTEEGEEGHRERVRRLEREALPSLRPAIDEITRRLGLEYYGIDCNLRPDGSLLIFEANANMNFLQDRFPELEGKLETVKDRIRAMVARHSGEKVDPAPVA